MRAGVSLVAVLFVFDLCESIDLCGCAKTGDCGSYPKAGVNRDGKCLEPGGTHKVCANVDAETLSWFKSQGNDLSSVVGPGGGWC